MRRLILSTAEQNDAVLAYAIALGAGQADPGKGLPDPVFAFALQITPMINVDLFIQDERRRTLLAWRDDAFGTGWHIPGGIVRMRERFADRIAEVARLELGAEVVGADESPMRLTQLLGEGRGHFISLLFRCTLDRPVGTEALSTQDIGRTPGALSWFEGAPRTLYPAHDGAYRDVLNGAG